MCNRKYFHYKDVCIIIHKTHWKTEIYVSVQFITHKEKQHISLRISFLYSQVVTALIEKAQVAVAGLIEKALVAVTALAQVAVTALMEKAVAVPHHTWLGWELTGNF